ncbi:preprotein translocase subunit YajC [Pontibacter sp. KCTC 32443]|uniref:preprotein translocase subunit YajC n=1 Tax=Pontibacter TaxID=323449 RepID=UPI00164CE0CD|nr:MULTISPECIES: preprotein translocase subunit YajC [Pontibacter]MBC5774484.1 preprotein translocase subunit YajC [Pontibacter sp. KCTC 32443]
MQTILLQAGQDGGILPQLLMFGAIILVFYFFMIRPQQKKAKDQKKFRDELSKGMSVVTIGGLHGKLVAMDDDTVVVEVDKGVRLTFEKSAISMEATAKVNQQPNS